MAFPTVASTTQTLVTSNDATPTVNYPATVDAGDLLILIGQVDNNTNFTITNLGDFTAFPDGGKVNNGVNVALVYGYRIADGSEDGGNTTLTFSAAERSAWRVIRITGWHGTTPPEVATSGGGTNTNPDPPSLDPSGWGTEDTLWIAAAACDVTTFTDLDPTNYSGGVQSSTADGSLAVSFRENAAGSEDPDVFTTSVSEQNCAITIAVRPSAGGSTFDLAGAPAATATMSGAIAHTYTVAGAASAVAALTGAAGIAYTVAGSASGTASMTGDVVVLVLFEGTASGTASMTGAITHGYAITGTASAVATAVGAIAHTYSIGGSAAAVAALAGDLLLELGEQVEGLASIELVVIDHATMDFPAKFAAVLVFSLRHQVTLSVETEYDLDDTASPTVTFTVDSAVTDPSTITLTVTKPDATSTDYTYAGGTVTKVGTGVYRKDVTLDQRGFWTFRFEGTGDCQAVARRTVRVRG